MQKHRTVPPGIRDSATVETAARFMVFWDADCVEVFGEDGGSRGVVTERDVVRSVAHRHLPAETRLADLVCPHPS